MTALHQVSPKGSRTGIAIVVALAAIVALCGVGGFVALAVGNGSAPAYRPPSAAPAESALEVIQRAAAESDADVVSVEPDGRGRWNILFRARNAFDNDGIREGIADDTIAIAARVRREVDAGAVEVESLFFEATFELVDEFGNERDGTVFTGRLSGDDLAAINFDNFSGMDALAGIGAVFFLHPDLES